METANAQITDAITQMNTLIVGSAAPQSLGIVDVAGAEALSMFMHNAVSAQQNSQISSSAAITSVCAKILQSQIPKPAKPPAPAPHMPPPFLPLDPTPNAEILINEANVLAEAAIATAKNTQGNLSPEMMKDIQQLINYLQTFVNTTPPTQPISPPSGNPTLHMEKAIPVVNVEGNNSEKK